MGDSKRGLTTEEVHALFDERLADVVSQVGVAIGRSIGTLSQEQLTSAEGINAATDRLAILASEYIAEAAGKKVLPIIGKALEGVRLGLWGYTVENLNPPHGFRLRALEEYKR